MKKGFKDMKVIRDSSVTHRKFIKWMHHTLLLLSFDMENEADFPCQGTRNASSYMNSNADGFSYVK